MPTRAALAAAYRATTYRLRLDGTIVDIRVDRPQPQLDRWLAAGGNDRWAWLTAVNPGSQPLDAADNDRRHAALRDDLGARGWDCVVGESIADAGDWPPEVALLVPGLDAAQAVALARAWGQNALLIGACGGPAKLLWVDAPGAD